MQITVIYIFDKIIKAKDTLHIKEIKYSSMSIICFNKIKT